MNALFDEIASLPPKQRLLLEQELWKQGVDLAKFRIFPRAEEREAYPLSFAQQRLWFLHQLEPDSAAYHVSVSLGLHGHVDVAALDRAFHEVVRRHEALRTTFSAGEDGQGSQVVHAAHPA